MKMTYRQMFEIMERTFTEEQWDSTVTLEDAEGECYPAELRICGEEHSCLDNGHPVIYCGLFDEDKTATDEEIEEYIKSLMISNSKCKTGMRVRVMGNPNSEYYGLTGNVIEVSAGYVNAVVDVKLDMFPKESVSFLNYELELID